MDVGALSARVKTRHLDGEELPSDAAIEEMLRTVIDRITIRMETADELPALVGSIVVDAAVKAQRLRGFEGSTSESAAEGGSVSNSFIDDILGEYDEELASLKRTMNRGRSGIRFFR